jgi:DNA end-binding protein Ku
MRTIWNGSISFGLVNIPVGLALATTPKAKQSDVSFRTLHRECKTPIRQKRWCPTHEREVGPDEIVKGWEVAKGEFVVVEDADLEAIQQHDDSRSIDITRFVPLDEVDPVYLDRTYYLAPAQAPAQRRPYVLLLEAMRQAGMGAIGRFILRGAEYFALIRPKGDALVLETLFLAEDVRSQAEIDEAVAGTEVKKAELDLAMQVMQSLVGDFEPEELHSQYRSDLRQMLEAKLDGQEISKPEPVPEAPVVDLMEALKRSVAESKKKPKAESGSEKAKAAPKSGSRSRRAPARKSA